MPDHAYERLTAGLSMPGVVIVASKISVGQAVTDLLLLVNATFDTEWDGQVHHLPLR